MSLKKLLTLGIAFEKSQKGFQRSVSVMFERPLMGTGTPEDTRKVIQKYFPNEEEAEYVFSCLKRNRHQDLYFTDTKHVKEWFKDMQKIGWGLDLDKSVIRQRSKDTAVIFTGNGYHSADENGYCEHCDGVRLIWPPDSQQCDSCGSYPVRPFCELKPKEIAKVVQSKRAA